MFGENNFLAIFTTGLLTGGITCIAVQGGILTSSLVQDKSKETRRYIATDQLLPVLSFIFSKLIAYTILGFFLGWLGSLIQVSLQVRILLQFFVVIFMIGTGLNLLNIHPFFRHFIILPPKNFMNFAYKKSESKRLFVPILLGFLTVLIPCGATQAMMALAVTSGSAFLGALIMFVFVLGTSPVFFLLGLFTVQLKNSLNKNFLKIAACFIILLALFNLDATLALANSPYTLSSVLHEGYCIVGYCDLVLTPDPVTEQMITFTNTGYTPNRFAVSKGTQVTLHLVNKNATGCIQAFTISALNIQKIVLPNQTADISFKAPATSGRITFTCSAGLYPGTIEVI